MHPILIRLPFIVAGVISVGLAILRDKSNKKDEQSPPPKERG